MNIDLTSTLDPDDVPEEWWLERMRNARNSLLAECDWRVLPDAPSAQEWVEYRQALRDFPATWTVGNEADFPDTP